MKESSDSGNVTAIVALSLTCILLIMSVSDNSGRIEKAEEKIARLQSEITTLKEDK